jgi:hypothetical protein
MFGMENKKATKTTGNVFLFDLEKELKDPAKQKEYAELIQKRINTIKELLRTGSKKEDFDHLGVLLNGYQALAVALGRAAKQAGAK